MASSYCVPELPGATVRQELAFLHTWGVCNEVAHYHVVLFGTLVIRYDFYIADCAAETLRIEYVVKPGWMVTRNVSAKMRVSLLEPGVVNIETIGFDQLQNSLTFSVTGTEAVPTVDITVHTSSSTNVTVPVTNRDKYLSGWDFGNIVLQPIIETFHRNVDDIGIAHLECIYREEGENRLANNQLE